MKINIGPYPERGEERKVEVKIHKYDAWNTDSTLALIIVPVLQKLKKYTHGYPSEFVQDDEDEDGSKGMAAWAAILDKMIWAFEQCNEDYEKQYYSGEVDIYWEPCEDNPEFNRMMHGPKHTFKVDLEGMAAHEERMQEGFDLFGKYYRNLWD